MKSSNLALRLQDEEAPACQAATEPDAAATREDAPRPAERRPRRSLEFRSIVINDQGFAPFRVR